jgi:hypothetical protein
MGARAWSFTIAVVDSLLAAAAVLAVFWLGLGL